MRRIAKSAISITMVFLMVLSMPIQVFASESLSVTGVELDQNLINIPEGTQYTLSATINPNEAENKILFWSSTNEKIAKVDEGVITAIAPGECQIIVITDDGGYSSSCKVTVEKLIGSGTCGNNISWRCTESGSLSLTGTGKMYDYDVQTDNDGTVRSKAPWRNLSVKTVYLDNKITHIGNYAFFNMKNGKFTNIDLPNSLISIGEYAFSYSSLVEVKLPSSLTSIGYGCFSNTDIEEIEISNSVTTIGNGAFMNCDKLVNVNLSQSLERIEESTFWGCSLTSISIPQSVTYLGRGAFLGNEFVEVVVPDNVIDFEDVVFAECHSLKKITFPKKVNSFGNSMLSYCEQLKTVTLPQNITTLPDRTFYECESINEIDLPDSITNIGSSAFEGATNLLLITMPNNLVEIGDYAFSRCKNLNNITIPNTIEKIGDRAFQACESLVGMTIPINVSHLGEGVFVNCYSLLDVSLYCKLTKINDNAFYGCKKLAKLVLPDSVVTVGKSNFASCSNLIIYYYGKNLNWDKIETADCNEYFLNAHRYNVRFDLSEIDYSGSNIEPIVIIYDGDTLLQNDKDYSIEYKDNLSPGIATLSIDFDTNFDANEMINLPFIINRIDASSANISIEDDIVYDGDSKEPKPTINFEGKILEIGKDYILDYSDNINSGTAICKVMFIGIYRGNINKTFTILPIDATNASVDNVPDQVYTGSPLKPSVVVKLNGNLLVEGQSYVVSYSNNTKVGTAKVLITFFGNYSRDNSLQHTFNIVYQWDEGTVQTEPTCTKNGIMLYKCVADTGITKTESIAALGHDYSDEWTIDKATTCTEKGSKSHHCTRCDSKSDVTEIPTLGHTWDNGKIITQPTCNKTGVMTYECQTCHETKTESIAALGHDYSDEWTIDKAATCTEKGSKSHHCTRCDSKSDVTEIDATNHTWNNGKITTQPTCDKTGVMTYECQTCHETKTESIAALGHDYSDEWTIDKVATCTEKGSKFHHCTRCDSKSDVTEIALIPHTYKTTTTKATTSKNGSIVSKCSVCSKVSSTKKIYYLKTISLSKISYVYNGKVQKPSITVKGSDGKTISSSNYTITYSSGCKYVGKYTVKITFKGNYSGSVSKTYTIVPKGTSIKSLTAGSKKIIVKWTKQAIQTTGYQIQYSTSSKFTSAKIVTVSKNSTVSKILSKLIGKKRYYVRIRTYKTVSGTKYYSSWSKVKYVTTKK